MRGKRLDVFVEITPYGITPADAGKTQFLMLAPRRDQDHPRGCGENATLRQPIGATRGSPPRMRGKQCGDGHEPRHSGITPADAGKTLRLKRRVRREQGSPPRMRGKRPLNGLKPFLRGITPADAGKTLVFLNFCRNL